MNNERESAPRPDHLREVQEGTPLASPATPVGGHVPRVAVVGVHGIGAHAAGATADAMADLLLSLPSYNPDVPNPTRSRYYEAFRAMGIQIPLQPVKVNNAVRNASPGKPLGEAFTEGSAAFASRELHRGVTATGDAGNLFTKQLLEKYEGVGDGNVYKTTRLEGRRPAKNGKAAADVHIYEVLWADLASPDNTFLSFFLALFQLILHLGSLSRLALDTSAAEQKGHLWSALRTVQRYAVRMLQIALPLLKLILLIALTSCIPSVSGKLSGARWLPIVLAVVAGIAIAFLILQKAANRFAGWNPWIWSMLAVIPGGVAGGAVAKLIASGHPSATTTDMASALLIWIVLGVGLLSFVLGKYEGVRSGAKLSGWALYAACLLTFVRYAIFGNLSVEQATFWAVEWIIVALRLSWWLLFVFAFLALVLGSLAWRLESDPEKKARARAAVRTSRFALALPCLLFVQITSLIWASLFFLADKIRKPFFSPNVLTAPSHPCWLVKVMLIPDPAQTAGSAGGDYLHGALAWSVGYQAPISLALFLLALFLLGWWVLPGVVTEQFRLRDQQQPPRNSTNKVSRHLGAWISRGLDATSVVTFLFWTGMFVAPVAFYFLPYCYQCCLELATVLLVTQWVVAISSAVLAGLVKYGSPILGAVLDVDTYLRTGPEDATPRAKIFERYVSTLRYLAHYRGDDGRGYDSIVIVAHSLGTLISADLLRFLVMEGDSELLALGLAGKQKLSNSQNVPIALLTMGSPIRQLLNRFFPHLYDWVRPIPDNGLRQLLVPAGPNPPAAIAASAPPDPAELGVAQWVNAYRSGDYVGRSLWLDEWYNRTGGSKGDGRYPQPIYEATYHGRTEMCIGAGAHTHYWDDTAPDIAEKLNQLI
jgi:hypothetical protein